MSQGSDQETTPDYASPADPADAFPDHLPIPRALFSPPAPDALAALGDVQMLCALLNERMGALHAYALPLGLSHALLESVRRYASSPLRISRNRLSPSGYVYQPGFCERPNLIIQFVLRPELHDDLTYDPMVDAYWRDIVIHELFDLDLSSADEQVGQILWNPSHVDDALGQVHELHAKTAACMYVQTQGCAELIEKVLAWREPYRS